MQFTVSSPISLPTIEKITQPFEKTEPASVFSFLPTVFAFCIRKKAVESPVFAPFCLSVVKIQLFLSESKFCFTNINQIVIYLSFRISEFYRQNLVDDSVCIRGMRILILFRCDGVQSFSCSGLIFGKIIEFIKICWS